ncbi:uroporphyrinogen III methyltransferase [Bacteroidia bacterium]|nr:uroporphyrinogen III methyltransferase [Bacteroidia bacterium]
MGIKRILVSQPKPDNEKSPYFDLAKRYGLELDFFPFIKVENVTVKEFRFNKIEILDHSAVIFTSKTAIDHFFRLCGELRVIIPDELKYFCTSESIAFYLQKYIVYRKRKIFHGNKSMEDMTKILLKHKNETYLLPLSDVHKENIPALLDKLHLTYTKFVLYRTVVADMKDVVKNIKDYDMLAFYTPMGIKSLKQNFPDFVQKETIIAAFGEATAEAVEKEGFRLDIAPSPQNPSMTMAIEAFIENRKNN